MVSKLSTSHLVTCRGVYRDYAPFHFASVSFFSHTHTHSCTQIQILSLSHTHSLTHLTPSVGDNAMVDLFVCVPPEFSLNVELTTIKGYIVPITISDVAVTASKPILPFLSFFSSIPSPSFPFLIFTDAFPLSLSHFLYFILSPQPCAFACPTSW